jgi:hypothetical protein
LLARDQTWTDDFSQANCPPKGAEKVNINAEKYSRERMICKAELHIKDI